MNQISGTGNTWEVDSELGSGPITHHPGSNDEILSPVLQSTADRIVRVTDAGVDFGPLSLASHLQGSVACIAPLSTGYGEFPMLRHREFMLWRIQNVQSLVVECISRACDLVGKLNSLLVRHRLGRVKYIHANVLKVALVAKSVLIRDP